MGIARIALRPDLRLVVAVAGVSAALLLPLVSWAISGGFATLVDDNQGYVGIIEDPAAFPPPGADVLITAQVARQIEYHVDVLNQESALAKRVLAQIPDHKLVESAPEGQLIGGFWQDEPPETVGWRFLPARGADAFEQGGAKDLQATLAVVTFASLPAVLILLVLFAAREGHALARTAATVQALGGRSKAARLVDLRVITVIILGSGAAVLGAYSLTILGLSPSLTNIPTGPLVAIAGTVAVAGVVAIIVGRRVMSKAAELARLGGAVRSPPERRLAFIPTSMRPLVLGYRVMWILAAAALLFVVDVGVPLSAAGIPAALAGDAGEWVLGGQDGLLIQGRENADMATVLKLDPAVDAAVAEVIVATTVNGQPILARGAIWEDLQDYHEIAIIDGRPPDLDEVMVGVGVTSRLGHDLGDYVVVQLANGPGLQMFRVAGIFEADGLLHDELILPLPAAQAIGGLDSETVSVIRAKPQSLDVKDAMGRGEPQIEVLDMRLEPLQPTAGNAATALVQVANRGHQTGVRDLTLRIDGEAVYSTQITVGGFKLKQVTLPYIVPEGPYQIDVNPSAQTSSRSGVGTIDAPAAIQAGQTFTLNVQGGDGSTGGRLILYDSLDAFVNGRSAVDIFSQTADGEYALFLPKPGRYVLHVDGITKEITAYAKADENRATADIVGYWIEPADARAGDEVTLHVQLHNIGGVAGSLAINISYGGENLTTLEGNAQPGHSVALTSSFITDHLISDIWVGERKLTLLDPIGLQKAPSQVGVRSGAAGQTLVADRLLGDSQRALGGVAVTAMISSLAVTYLAADGAIRGRGHVLVSLRRLGLNSADIRARAAIEGAALGAIVVIAALLVLAIVFTGFQIAGWPVVFGHVLLFPFRGGAIAQAILAFAAAAAAAAYLASGSVGESDA